MIRLLDCTLRDGGYYTLWDFEDLLVEKYSHLISRLPVEYIEIGYRSREQDDYYGEFFYSPIETIKKIKRGIDPSQKIALMLNAKDCLDTDIVRLLDGCGDDVTLVRIATDPDKIEHTLDLAKRLKSLGYEVAVNIMYISTIVPDHHIYKSIEGIDSYVDHLYLVDSYGSIYPDALEEMIKRFQKHSDVTLGFHGHNNIELAFVNALRAMACGVEMIDSTILGMGRGAGNLKLELLLSHLQAKEAWEVDLNALGLLVEGFTPLLKRYRWGTNLPYIVSGSYALPQKDVMDAIEINRYSIASIVNTMCLSSDRSLPLFKNKRAVKSCVLIGGGASVKQSIEVIRAYLKADENRVIIHSTSKYIDAFATLKNRQLFCVGGDELTKLNDKESYPFIDQFVFETSPRKIDVHLPPYDNMAELEDIGFIEHFHDSPFTISLQTALDIEAEEIELIGFDGYMELKSKKEFYLMHENQEIISAFTSKRQGLCSLTKTNYKGLDKRSIYSRVG